jgi:hypothetical protein
MRNLGWLVLGLAATACGSGSESAGGTSGPAQVDGVPLMSGFDPGPAPAAGTGFQIVLPVVTGIQPGGSYEWCTWTSTTTTSDLWVKESIGRQTESGHHIVVYYSLDPQPAGTSRICQDSDMASFRFGVGVGGEGAGGDARLPGDLAVHIPKGAQIVINHHYLNASGRPIAQAQSAVTVLYAPQGQPLTESSSLAFVDTSMNVPPGLRSVDYTCTLQQDFQAWQLLPHMHNFGTRITVDHTSASGTERLFDVQWDPSFAFHPPTKNFDPAAPYAMHKGDQVHVHCDYDNTSAQALTFGVEMCVSYAQTVDTAQAGNILCDLNQWSSF